MAALKRVEIEILGQKFSVPFPPTTSAFIDIQTVKSKLTEDRHETYSTLGRDGMIASVIVDAISTFNILIGKEIKETLNLPGLSSLPLETMIAVAYEYQNVYVPFYEEIMAVISAPKKKVEVEPSKETVIPNA